MRKQLTVDDVRSFTLERFEQIKKTNDMKKLVNFHTINKYLLLAYSQKELKILGNLVANRDKNPNDTIFNEYGNHLRMSLNGEITIPSTVNVLNKIYSHFKKKFTPDEKKLFLKIIGDFRDEKILLSEVLNHVDDFIDKYENGYLKRQTFYLLYSEIRDDF